MKISENFDLREFVPRATFEKWGPKSTYFIDPWQVSFAEFLKKFLREYYKTQDVAIAINTYMYNGQSEYRGYRPPECTEGAKESQHRFSKAIDTEIKVNKVEVSYPDIHKLVHDNELLFMGAGLTTIEDVACASGWMHWDKRWTMSNNILIVKP